MSYKMTKKCKKKSDIDYADEVQETTAATTPMKRISMCLWHVAKHWHWKMGVKKHIKEDHTELCWHYCGKMLGKKRK